MAKKHSCPRWKSIGCGCTESEFATIQAAAEVRGIRAGTYLRMLALELPLPAPRPAVFDQQALAALGRIGSLLNQMAHVMNQTKEVPPDAVGVLRQIQANLSVLTRRVLDGRPVEAVDTAAKRAPLAAVRSSAASMPA